VIFEALRQPRSGAQALSQAEAFGRKHWSGVTACAIAGGVVLYLLYLYTRFPLPPGTDAGQWLSVSRFYLGEHVPEGRSVATVPPLVPIILAVLSPIGGPTGAIAGIAVLSYGLIAIVSYRLGARLTGDATGGLLALVAIAVIQSQLFEFFAMGAFPQLMAIGGMAFMLYALLGLASNPDDRSEWFVLAGGLAITLFSHTPSATIALPIGGACLLYVVYSSDDRGLAASRIMHILGPVVAVWALFLFANRDVIFGYAGIDAAYELKGPDKLFHIIWRDNVQRVVFLAGLSATAALPFMTQIPPGRRGSRNPAVMLVIWTAGLAAIVAFAAVRQTGTDYPRFIAYFIVPFGLAVAACVQSLKPSPGAVAALLVPVLLFAGHDALRHFDTATRFYGINERSSSLNSVAAWLDQQPGEDGVIGGTRETKWLEALTGRDSLLYLPRVYITRPWEVDRALEAEVLHRSSGGIETGRMLITANDGGQDFGKVFPNGVRFDLFDSGLYVHCLTLRDQTAAVTFASYGATTKVSLASMSNQGTRAYEDLAGKHLATTFISEDAPISIVRVVTADSLNTGVVNLDYFVGSPAGVRPDSFVVGTGDPGSIEVKPDGSGVLYTELPNGEEAQLVVHTSWQADALPPQDANPFLTWRRASIQFNAGAGEHRVPYAQLFDPVSILRSRHVRYIVDRDGDGAAFPLIRDLDLQPVYENSVYKVYEVPGLEAQ
jgi:hypothetical protein